MHDLHISVYKANYNIITSDTDVSKFKSGIINIDYTYTHTAVIGM